MKKHLLPLLALLSFFLFSLRLDAVTFNVTVPDGVNGCWIVGNFNFWINSQYKMNKVDQTHFTLTLDDTKFNNKSVNLSNLRYNYLYDKGDWSYVEKGSFGEYVPERIYHENDTVKKWSIINYGNYVPIRGYATIRAQVPSTVSELYVVGTFCDWTLPTDSTKMELISTSSEGNVFSLKIWAENAYYFSYRLAAGPSWDYLQTYLGDIACPLLLDSTKVVEMNSFFDIYSGITPVVKSQVRVHTNASSIVVDGTSVGESVSLITPSGVVLKTVQSQGDRLRFSVPQGANFLIKTATKTVKVAM
ncbi:MAG: hypothetical protein ACOYOT_03685 [Bacteroidales bacterium]